MVSSNSKLMIFRGLVLLAFLGSKAVSVGVTNLETSIFNSGESLITKASAIADAIGQVDQAKSQAQEVMKSPQIEIERI